MANQGGRQFWGAGGAISSADGSRYGSQSSTGGSLSSGIIGLKDARKDGDDD